MSEPFELTTTQREFVDWAIGFARDRLAADALTWQHRDSAEAYMAHAAFLAEYGLLGQSLPVEHGGAGLPLFDALLVVEAVATVCPYSANVIRNTVAGPAIFLARLGSEELCARHLPDVVQGRGYLAVCMTEPDAGSASKEMRSRLTRTTGSELCLDGHKVFITNADRASAFVVYARFEHLEGGPVGAVVIERDRAGVEVGPAIEWMGGSVFPVSFTDVVVTDRDVLVAPDGGGDAYKRLMGVYDVERIGGLFELIGIGQHVLDRSVAYACEREQFGSPIADYQATQLRLADMKISLEAMRLLTYRTAARVDRLGRSSMDASIARVHAGETIQRLIGEGIQVHGAVGLTKEAGLEWLYRWTRHYTIAGGTSDIHRILIAGALTGRRLEFGKGNRNR